MVGFRHLRALLLLSTVLVGCSHIQPDPYFWPGTKHRLRTVKATEFEKRALPTAVSFKTPPSVTRSEWNMVSKSSFAQRTYELILKDEAGKLLDSPLEPEMILEGPVVLHHVIRTSEAKWLVKLEFTVEQSLIDVGIKIGGHRIDHFRQIDFQTHDLDMFQTASFTNKSRVRADGKDVWRVYVDLKDQKGHNIYSLQDFSLQLHLDKMDATVNGPFSGASGPFFEVTRTKQGDLGYFVTVDGERILGAGQVEFLDPDRRGPAAEKRDCLLDLSHISETPVPKNVDAEAAYMELAHAIMRRYEEKQDARPETLQKTLDSFSSEACSSNRIWDQVRDEAGRSLRNIHRRLSARAYE